MQEVYEGLNEQEQKFFDSKKASYYSFDNKSKLERSLVKLSAFNKKPSLFCNAINLDTIDGFDQVQSKQLIVEQLQKAVTEEGVYAHQWQEGDLVLFDNVALMHAADDSIDEIERLICRIIIQ